MNVEALANLLHEEDLGRPIDRHAEACPNPDVCPLPDGYRADAARYADALKSTTNKGTKP